MSEKALSRFNCIVCALTTIYFKEFAPSLHDQCLRPLKPQADYAFAERTCRRVVPLLSFAGNAQSAMSAIDLLNVTGVVASLVSLGIALDARKEVRSMKKTIGRSMGNVPGKKTQTITGSGNLQAGGHITQQGE